ncbi:MAG: GNAT family N-acetyltransferase [Eubacteriales bacterium]|nr:GNAT family N-acetyltransferase [Eubacteriales bacterium]
MYHIREYQERDREKVRAICLATGPQTEELYPGIRKALCTVFCDYYIEEEPENCFVAVDEQDEAQGYILCAGNWSVWARRFRTEYLEKGDQPIARAMGEATIRTLEKFAERYPAHLHIDLLPQAQGQGAGSRLIRTLEKHLCDEGVWGLCLCVAADNTGARLFYQKNGFTELLCEGKEVVMGKTLEAERA